MQLQFAKRPGIAHLQKRILRGKRLAGGTQGLHVLRLFGNHLHGDQRRAQMPGLHPPGQQRGIPQGLPDLHIPQAVHHADFPRGEASRIAAIHPANLGDLPLYQLFLARQRIQSGGQGDGRAVLNGPAIQAHPHAPAQHPVLGGGEHHAAQRLSVRGGRRQEVHHGVQQRKDALVPQGRAAQHRIRGGAAGQPRQALPDQGGRNGFPGKILFQQFIILPTDEFARSLLILKEYRVRGKQAVNLRQHTPRIRALAVCFVQEKQRGDRLLLQRVKESLRVGLHALHRADHHHRRVQRPQGALHLGGEIHMPGGVDQVDAHIPPGQADAGGLHGNAPALLHRQIVGMGRARVNASGPANCPGMHQQLLGKGGFPRVHVGKNADIAHGGMASS